MIPWINVKDELPEPGLRVLVTGQSRSPFSWFVGRKHYFACCLFDNMGKRQWCSPDGESVPGTVTHWMPLPELP